MFELEEQHRIMEQMIRAFCEKEIAPHVEAMEREEVLPFDIMRDLAKKFGIDRFISRMEKSQDKEQQGGGEESKKKEEKEEEAEGEDQDQDEQGLLGIAGDPMMGTIVGKELSRVSPGLCLALGASLGLCGGTIMAKGTPEQKKKYGLPVLGLQKVGCWGMTEPESGSDAFALKTIARPKEDGYIINGSKTFITNAPYADVLVVYAKIDRGQKDPRDKRFIFPFVMEKDTEGLSVSKPMKKMGMKASPTGEIFLDDVFVKKDQLLGETEEKSSREQAKDVFAGERSGAPTMCWGIIERCLDDSIKYATERKQWGRPLAEFQLIQEKLARMYVHLENVRNIAFKQAWATKNRKATAADQCAAKYYCANAAVEVALDAIQLMGGYGYMQEYHVEMLMRDAKLISIGGGTDEIQLLTIAKELLKKHDFEVTISGTREM
ncbi:MAG: acyl-CoA dehydrogenase family protein [bacterium]